KRRRNSAWRPENVSEMYFRKMSPSTRCLYSAASILARSLSAAAHRVFLMSSSMGGWVLFVKGCLDDHRHSLYDGTVGTALSPVCCWCSRAQSGTGVTAPVYPFNRIAVRR